MAAQTSIMASGALQPIITGKPVHLGVLRTLQTMKVMDGAALRLVANFVQPMSVTARDVGNGVHGSTTSAITSAVVVGGASPFTYAWAILSGSSTINSPTLASTSFIKPGGFSGGDSITAQVTVTDRLGTIRTATMTATWSDGVGGGF